MNRKRPLVAHSPRYWIPCKHRGSGSSSPVSSLFLCLSYFCDSNIQALWSLPPPCRGHTAQTWRGWMTSGHQKVGGTWQSPSPPPWGCCSWSGASSRTTWHFPAHTPFGKGMGFDEPSCPLLFFSRTKANFSSDYQGRGYICGKWEDYTLFQFQVSHFVKHCAGLDWVTNYSVIWLPMNFHPKEGGGFPISTVVAASVRSVVIDVHQM